MSVERSELNVERSAPKGAVFLSYASQDAEAARRIADALRAAGVEVWFDQSELRGGDAWDAKIRKQIKECALFVPIISANTQARAEGYFRLEWKLAVDRSHLMADDAPFLFPVIIDDTPDAMARVPDKFRDVQWTRLSVKDTPETLAVQVGKLLGGGPPEDRGQKTEDRTGRTKSRPTWLRYGWAGVGIVFALVYAIRPMWQSSRRPEPAPVTVAPATAAVAQSEAQQLAEKARAMSLDKYNSTADDYATAEGLLRRALELEQNDAEIWAISSMLHTNIRTRGFDHAPVRREWARRDAERAVKLGPDSQNALFALGRSQRDTDPVAAEGTFKKLLFLNPENADAMGQLGWLYDSDGRVEEASKLYDRVLVLDPANAPLTHYVRFLLFFHYSRFAEAEQAIRRSVEMEPSANSSAGLVMLLLTAKGDAEESARVLAAVPAAFRNEPRIVWVEAMAQLCRRDPEAVLRALQRLQNDYIQDNWFAGPKAYFAGLVHAMAGRAEAARVAWQSALAIVDTRLKETPDNPILRLCRGQLLAWLGQTDEARREARLLDEMRAGRPTRSWFGSTALIHAAVGDTDKAMPLLEQLMSVDNSTNVGWPLTRTLLRLDPRWDKLRADPRFQKLCEEPAAVLTEDRGQKTEVGVPIDQKSVAVLAFANLSSDKEQEYFSDGISEELLNVLAKVPGLKVTARTSSFHFKGKDTPIPKIAQQLGVAYVVEGSVRKAGDKVRITAQLIKAADGFHVWSDTFTRDLKDIFAVQDEIAGLIAKNLELKMGMVAARPTVDLEAYQEYLTGRALFAKAGTADLRLAVSHFERAVAIEPKFTAAWVQLASAHTRLGRWGGAPTRQAWQSARAAIDRATVLEPESPDVLLALGWILRTGEWNWREAERVFRRALALQPNQPEILAGAAVLLYNIGQTEEAFRLARQAIQLDPLNAGTQIDLSLMFFMNKNWAEAERAARRALQLAPGGTSYHCIMAWSLIAQQRYPEAEAEINLDKTEDGVDRTSTFGLLAIARGQDKVARGWLARLEEIARANGDLADLQQNIAWLCASLGEKDRAFAALERAYTSRDPSMSWLLNSWYLQPLFSDPRWDALLHKVGLADDQLK